VEQLMLLLAIAGIPIFVTGLRAFLWTERERPEFLKGTQGKRTGWLLMVAGCVLFALCGTIYVYDIEPGPNGNGALKVKVDSHLSRYRN
jgi:hypothetical protein